MSRVKTSRRDILKLASMGLVGYSMSGWLQALADESAGNPKRKRSCILLWMAGGPSQTDTFDMKPGHKNGGEFKPIDTSVPGVRISEHLPKLAKVMDHLAPVRSMSTKEGDHSRGTYLMRTGRLPQGPINYPTMGSVLSKELGRTDAELPNYVSIAPYRFLSPAAFGPGFLGPQHSPLVFGGANGGFRSNNANYEQALQVRNLTLPQGVTTEQADARLGLLNSLEDDFTATRPGLVGRSHRTAYDAAVRMMRSEAVKAFQLNEEDEKLRDAYGRNTFGQGCLLARRLVERGVAFVEVSLNSAQGAQGLGWDTHQRNFNSVKSLSEVLDPGWATLMTDLKDRGLLDDTLVVWMGEFGRTPNINQNGGRDHFPAAWTTVVGGGGIKGGQVYGATEADGMKVKDNPVSVSDLLATVCKAVNVDPMSQNMSNVGRPIRLADPEATPIDDILA